MRCVGVRCGRRGGVVGEGVVGEGVGGEFGRRGGCGR